MTYAADTTVPISKSKVEIDQLLQRAGATQRGMATDDEKGTAILHFAIAPPGAPADRRHVRIVLPMPKLSDMPAPRTRKSKSRQQMLEQAQRARWRALALVIKAKLEAVEVGITTIEREFFADIALPNGQSIHEALRPGLREAYASGQMPSGALLLGPSSGQEAG